MSDGVTNAEDVGNIVHEFSAGGNVHRIVVNSGPDMAAGPWSPSHRVAVWPDRDEPRYIAFTSQVSDDDPFEPIGIYEIGKVVKHETQM